MAQYPPPPGPEQSHYGQVYPNSTGLSNADGIQSAHESSQYTSNGQPTFSKAEDQQDSSTHYQNTLAQELRRHTVEDNLSPALQYKPPPQHQHQQQQQQQQQQASQLPAYHTPVASIESGADQPAKAAHRLRKACDSCSIRKVKCDESGPPCRACAALDIPCTFQRPTRRRGPPNRHAEAIKRQKLDDSNFTASYSGPPSPSSPSDAAQALAALSSHTSVQDVTAESICPIETLDLLINDFFTYIHPLCPFPHEPSFREAWKRREDLSNKSFLALLASMIGALVASFPRKPRLDLKVQKKERLFPNHMSLVHRCQHICALARGPGYLENEHISVYDAATSYFLGLMGTYTFRWRQGRLYFGECLTIIRVLGYHRAKDPYLVDSFGSLPVNSDLPERTSQQPVDNITTEIGRRIFWTIFVGVKTLQQLGADFGELQIPPPTATDSYPPLPVEVDDFCIYPDRIDSQPADLLPIITGFNANVRAFTSYNAIAVEELGWHVDHKVDYGRQKKVLRDCLRRCKSATFSLPPQLKVDMQTPRAGTQQNGSGFYGLGGNREPARSLLSLAGGVDVDLLHQNDEEQRHMQYEIQKANIHASTLSTRAYIVEKYWNLVEAQARARAQPTPSSAPGSPDLSVGTPPTPAHRPAPTSNFDTTEQEFGEERELIVKDLLIVLSSIDLVNMEPNGESFTMKIRSIASMLLDAPESGRRRMEIQTKEYLSAFLQILVKLERSSAASSDSGSAEDEAAQLRDWANLREYQSKFAQHGGMYSLS